MKLFSYLIVLVFIAQTAFALELDEMQKMALGNRKIIKRYITNFEKSEKDIKRARSGYYPSVDLTYTVNSLDEGSLSEAKENSVIYGVVSWNLFSGFRDKYSLESAKLLKMVEVNRLDGVRQDIQLNVALRYLSVYERKANLKVSEDAFTTLSKIYRDGESRLNVGLIDKNELLKFKVDLDNADITQKAARASLEKSISLLIREIESPLQLEDLDFSEFSHIPDLGDQAKSEDLMMRNRSEIKALQGLVDAARKKVNIEQSDYYPKLNLEGSYLNYDDDYINGNGDNSQDELRARLVLSMNLYKGFSDQADIAKARLEVRGLQYDLRELEDDMKTGLKNLYIDYKVSLENVSVAEQNIELAKENLRITQLKYDEGLQRESDLLDAITNLSRAQFNYVTVIRTVFEKHFNITRMVEGFLAGGEGSGGA